jgi:hypothetical protein
VTWLFLPKLPEDAGGVRTIIETKNGRLLVGTTANSIYEGSLDSAFREQSKAGTSRFLVMFEASFPHTCPFSGTF